MGAKVKKKWELEQFFLKKEEGNVKKEFFSGIKNPGENPWLGIFGGNKITPAFS